MPSMLSYSLCNYRGGLQTAYCFVFDYRYCMASYRCELHALYIFKFERNF
jgi:hypothetical protein